MAANTYHFVTVWRVQGILQEITGILNDAPGLARWWPSVYLDVQEIAPGDHQGLGRVISLYSKGWLPYTLRWQFRITEVNHPFGFTIKAWGDLVGRGIWTFEAEEPGWVRITYDWQIAAEKPVLKYLSLVMKPIFSANHRWAMARGEESLKLEMARQHARAPADLARIPEPTGPTFSFLLPRNGKAPTRLLV